MSATYWTVLAAIHFVLAGIFVYLWRADRKPKCPAHDFRVLTRYEGEWQYGYNGERGQKLWVREVHEKCRCQLCAHARLIRHWESVHRDESIS